MRMLRIILPAIAAAGVLAPASGQADPYRWCAQYGARGGGTNCGFVTLQQCQMTISGMGGWCVPNQFYTGPERSTTGSGRHKKKVYRERYER
jgi:hypothetical protein